MITRCQFQNGTSKQAGYSLVEVTLALLVVAIGLTATFGLFPEGLKATRAAVNDTEAALFAEYVFTTLDLTAQWKGDYGQWRIEDTGHFTSKMFSQDPSDAIRHQLEDGGKVAHFYWDPNYYGYGSGDYKADNFKEYYTSSFTYTLEIGRKGGGGGGVPTYALLKVWPGDWDWEQIPDEKKFPPRVFYREILPLR
jgi:prepilin-type N-terminal cleavage/methylation domain-containing protein